MADNTKIEWTDATWNPITGCSVISPGCTNCYAMKLAGTRMRNHWSRAGLTDDSRAGPVWNGQVRFNEQWLTQPLHWTKPRRIFVCAHADLFHENVPDEWIDRIFAIMALADIHTFQILTKRAARMREYLSDPRVRNTVIGRAWAILGYHPKFKHHDVVNRAWPLSNVWLGVSAEDQKRADERVTELLRTPAAVRWISAEPLLADVDLSGWLWGRDEQCAQCPKDEDCECGWKTRKENGLASIDWVVAGGESGAGARPMHPAWARSLRDQCSAANVPFLFKQHGQFIPSGANAFESDAVTAAVGRASTHEFEDGTQVFNVGKKLAGRTLDGRTWDQYPEVT